MTTTRPSRAKQATAALSPEQRWTATVAMLLAAAIWLFGHPDTTVSVRRPAAAERPSSRSSAAVSRQPTLPVVAPPLAVHENGLAPGDPTLTAVGAGHAPAAGAHDGGVDEPAPATRVAAVATASGLPGRDDATMARAFLADAGIEATVVTIGDDPGATCAAVAAAADVAIASLGLGEPLRSCLLDRGIPVLAFDGLGPSAGPHAGRVISTRRGVRDSLVDLAHWAVANRVAPGPVGLVASSSVRREVEAARAAMGRAGLDVVETAFVADGVGPDAADVRRVAAAADTVVFAAPTAVISRWALAHSLLDAGVRYVVADAFDAVWNESYPPVLEGALAHTSIRVPWHGREVGETDVQAACRTTWEAAATPPALLGTAETVRVYAWCLHVRLVAAAAGDPTAIEVLTVPSPLTSDLGPLAPASWGPRQDAVLAWRASCGCWRQTLGFTDRAAR